MEVLCGYQDLAEGLELQVGQVLGQLGGVQVVAQKGHLALLREGGLSLSHLSLPFVRGTGHTNTGSSEETQYNCLPYKTAMSLYCTATLF